MTDEAVKNILTHIKDDFSISLQLYGMGEIAKADYYLNRCVVVVSKLIAACPEEERSYMQYVLLKEVHSMSHTHEYSIYVA